MHIMASARPVFLWQTSFVINSRSKAFMINRRWIWSYIPWLGLAFSSVDPHRARASKYFRDHNIVPSRAIVTYLFQYATGRASLHHQRIISVLERYHSSDCSIRVHDEGIVVFRRRAIINIHTAGNEVYVLCPPNAKLSAFLFISGVLAMAT